MASARAEDVTPVHDLLSVSAFKAFLWLSTAIMTLTFAARVTVRLATSRSLLIEDAVMIIALLLFLGIAVIGTLYAQDLYNLSHIVDGSFVPGPTFNADTEHALRVILVGAIFAYLGLWAIKINFLLFFYRLVNQLPKFRRIWWFVFAFVVASGIVQVGIIEYPCFVGGINTILGSCSTLATLYESRRRFIVSVTLDIICDLLMIVFPLSVFWSSRLKMRQKIFLTATFSLVAVAIAITIVRGGFSTNLNEPAAASQLNVAFTFWVTLEYFISFLIACVVSFRSLFVQQRAKRAENRALREWERTPTSGRERPSGGLGARVRQWQESFVDTCHRMEGTDTHHTHQLRSLPKPESGHLTDDYIHAGSTSDWKNSSDPAHQSSPPLHQGSPNDSLASLRPVKIPTSPA